MAIKNYTTKVPAHQSIKEIETALVKNGALGIMYRYEQGTGRIEALNFQLRVLDTIAGFSLPVNWKRFQACLKRDNVPRWRDEEYVYRVAWRCIRDWVLAQLALYETEMIEIPQIFLPFAMSNNGQTLYEQIVQGGFFLNAPKA